MSASWFQYGDKQKKNTEHARHIVEVLAADGVIRDLAIALTQREPIFFDSVDVEEGVSQFINDNTVEDHNNPIKMPVVFTAIVDSYDYDVKDNNADEWTIYIQLSKPKRSRDKWVQKGNMHFSKDREDVDTFLVRVGKVLGDDPLLCSLNVHNAGAINISPVGEMSLFLGSLALRLQTNKRTMG